jgi:hypothetical protein
MAALTKERDTPTQHYDFPQSLKVKGNVKIFNGAMVSTDATGFAVPSADVAATNCIGRANATVDTTAAGPLGLLADGAVEIEVLVGVATYNNPAGANQLTQVDVGKLAFVLTDNEVIRTAGTANTRIAGRVTRVDVVSVPPTATIDFRQHAV